MDKQLKVVARMRSDFPQKFGIPRQSGLVEELRGEIVFEPEFRNSDALRGMEGFSHLWLIWGFSANEREATFSPTVRPPRLGGNERLGVFATRSPFRPNGLGLSCVRLEKIELQGPDGPVLHVSGADLMDGTPIYDIKPYVPYADCYPEATEGFASRPVEPLRVEFPGQWLDKVPRSQREALVGVLAQDPRPRYLDDPQREYGMAFGGLNVRFTVDGEVLTVTGIERKRET